MSKHYWSILAPESGQNSRSPLTASELLVALHNIDPSKCDMKTVMKGKFLSEDLIRR